MKASANKDLIRTFYRKLFIEQDLRWIIQSVHEDYIQYSPHLPTGRSALLQVLEFLKQQPKTNSDRPEFLLIEEGDYVASLWYAVVGGKRRAIIDLFRLKEGKLAEHWDATEESMNSPMENEPCDTSDKLKEAAVRFVREHNPNIEIARIIREDNVAMVQSHVVKEYVLYTVIIFKNNVIYDFREVRQSIPASMPHQNGMI